MKKLLFLALAFAAETACEADGQLCDLKNDKGAGAKICQQKYPSGWYYACCCHPDDKADSAGNIPGVCSGNYTTPCTCPKGFNK